MGTKLYPPPCYRAVFLRKPAGFTAKSEYELLKSGSITLLNGGNLTLRVPTGPTFMFPAFPPRTSTQGREGTMKGQSLFLAFALVVTSSSVQAADFFRIATFNIEHLGARTPPQQPIAIAEHIC